MQENKRTEFDAWKVYGERESSWKLMYYINISNIEMLNITRNIVKYPNRPTYFCFEGLSSFHEIVVSYRPTMNWLIQLYELNYYCIDNLVMTWALKVWYQARI